MKKLLLSVLALFCAVNFSFAQFNTTSSVTSATNQVSIGTTSPISGVNFQVQKTSSQYAMMIGGAYYGSPRLQVYGLDADPNAWMGLGTDMGGGPYEHSVYFPTGPTGTLGKLTIGDYNGTTYNTRMMISANGNIGIGTTSPSAKLQVSSAANYNIIQDQIVANGDINGGTSTNPAYYGGIRLSGNGADWGAIRTIQTNPNGAWTNRMAFFTMNGNGGSLVERMSIDNSGNVGINTTNTNGYTFAVNGSAIATLIKVTANTGGTWPDYVFQPSYKLLTLNETEAYIAQNHHLPDMPSAADIAKDDINLGEMDKLLTKKVEELTLYLIEKDKENKELKQAVNAQQKEINDLKKQFETLTQTLNKK